MAKRTKKSLEPTPLDRLCQLADEVGGSTADLSRRDAKLARAKLIGALENLRRAAVALDPIRQPSSVFDPAHPRTVGLFVSIALLAQKREPLLELSPFYGSGVYAIYYSGGFRAYRPLVQTEHPIYVGKADPAVADAKTPEHQQHRLWRRLKDHAKAIRGAENLSLEDFACRHLVVASGLQVAAESYLIHLFKPIWNKEMKLAYGIGKHGDAPTTRANLRSPWDTLHAGRTWAHSDVKMKDQASQSDIVTRISAHFKANRPFTDIDAVLHRFYEDLKQQ